MLLKVWWGCFPGRFAGSSRKSPGLLLMSFQLPRLHGGDWGCVEDGKLLLGTPLLCLIVYWGLKENVQHLCCIIEGQTVPRQLGVFSPSMLTWQGPDPAACPRWTPAFHPPYHTHGAMLWGKYSFKCIGPAWCSVSTWWVRIGWRGLQERLEPQLGQYRGLVGGEDVLSLYRCPLAPSC